MKTALIATAGAVAVAGLVCLFVYAAFWASVNYGWLGLGLVACGALGACFGGALAVLLWGEE